MILLATLLAVAAVLLALPPRTSRRLQRDRAGTPVPTGSRQWRPRAAVPPLALFALPAVVLVLVGARAAVLSAVAAVVVGTVLHLLRLRARRVAATRSRAEVAEACALLSANLRVGMVPTQALAAAAGTCPVLREAQRTLALGGDVVAVWDRQAREEGLGGLRDLARAWRVGTRSGASLTATLEQVASALSADEALRAVVGSELAAPRATGKLMAALPALGVGMGYLLGGDPLAWLVQGLAGWTCLVLGTALACAGVLWIESLARRAGAPA